MVFGRIPARGGGLRNQNQNTPLDTVWRITFPPGRPAPLHALPAGQGMRAVCRVGCRMPLNVDMLPLGRQEERWREALAWLGLAGEHKPAGRLSAEILRRDSPSGAQIARLRAARQVIAHRGARKGHGSLYLILHRRGRGRYRDGPAFRDGTLTVPA